MKTRTFEPAIVRSTELRPVAHPPDLPTTRVAMPRCRIDVVSDLPGLTFGQLGMLTSVGTPFMATIRKTGPGYTVEVEVGPRRWVLVSTHRKTPRLFFHLDGAARAVRLLKPQSVSLELNETSGSGSPTPALLPDEAA